MSSSDDLISYSKNPETYKDYLHAELFSECLRAHPGEHLSQDIIERLIELTAEDRKQVVNYQKTGRAPLFVACKRGNVKIVRFLLNSCGADIEQRGMYEVSEDHTIHYVTPLWCASVSGKLPVVRCLVEHGANVNSVSDTGSTPVRSACFMSHYDVVVYLLQNDADIQKPNYNGGTCLINSVQSVRLCKFLLESGADVNAQDIQLKTALHYAIQEHRIETTKLLLDHGANPFIKSRYNDDALQTACLKGTVRIFNMLIERFTYPRERVVEAYELIGSTIFDEHQDVQATLFYWTGSIHLRGLEPIIVKPSDPSPNPAYLHAIEFQTVDESRALAQDNDALVVQSLLICERILGRLHRDLIFRLMYHGASYGDHHEYQRCIDLWCYALQLRIEKDSLLHNEVCFAAQALARLFIDLYEKSLADAAVQGPRINDVFNVIELLTNQLGDSMYLLKIRPIFSKQLDNIDKILKVIIHFFYILSAIPKSDEEQKRANALLTGILSMKPRNSSGDTLLHMVVSRSTAMRICNFYEAPETAYFPNSNLGCWFIKCNADVDAVNYIHSSPLHIASLPINYDPLIVDMLLQAGAHIDRRNDKGNCPYLMLKQIPECHIHPLPFISLQCLAARAIIDNKIPYKDKIPVDLTSFVSIH